MSIKKPVILSGMRPTGRLQLGNYFGALENWIKLQEEYCCYFCIVDWHALTTVYENPSEIKENVYEMVKDWVSAGIDPERSVIFRQSDMKEHAELHLLFSMITPLPWLERCPTYKEQLRELEGRNLATYGFLGYPLLQSADILIYKANAVPVGEDQAPHVELAREIARRFNYLYRPIFPEPSTLLNEYKLIPGLDGRKMSKSYKNYILLSEDPEQLNEKVRLMITDPQRIRKTDPGHPEVCVVHSFHEIVNKGQLLELEESCRRGEIGCVQCKKKLSEKLKEFLSPILEKRLRLEGQTDLIEEILRTGKEKAIKVASKTMEEVREAMGL